jgi:Fur family ferric uptake transcriptional regulator
MSKDFSSTLKEKGLKNTPIREVVLNVFSTDCKPINAEYIFGKLKSKKINLVTIYRTLASLEGASILHRVDMHKGSAFYELGLDHHHHLVCTDCGMIEKFKACDIERVARDVLKHSHFRSVNTHSLELFGMCKKCS